MSLPLSIEIYNELECCFKQKASFITLPSQTGEIGILPKHIKLFSVLKKGTVVINSEADGSEKEYAFNISGGFVEVDNDKVKLFAETIESVENVKG